MHHLYATFCVIFLFFANFGTNSHALTQLGSDLSKVVLCGRRDQYQIPYVPYTFNTNGWGDDGSGASCITVAQNGTKFSSTWIWRAHRAQVHAFPNIQLNSGLLPLQLSNLSALNLKSSWSMAPSIRPDIINLDDVSVTADVVIDMFLDPQPAAAISTTLPKYEIMVWFAAFGGKKPLGYNLTANKPPTLSLENGANFELYHDYNGNGQYVYSWYSDSSIESFDNDISPLIEYLWKQDYIPNSNYLGIVQFGTETFHADANVTFSVWDFDMNIVSGMPSAASLSCVPSFDRMMITTVFVLSMLI